MAPPRGILGSGRQRQLERARGGERVLVEHLVEIPHPEKDDRVAVLPLGFEILPHGRGRAGGFEKQGGNAIRGALVVSITRDSRRHEANPSINI